MEQNRNSPTPEDELPTVEPQEVVEIALRKFARKGFAATKLDGIAKLSGMSKRMIHYHFGDKKGLYTQALALSISRLHPPEEELILDTAVPVEGVRRLIDAMYTQCVANPDSIELIMRENQEAVLTGSQLPPVSDESSMTLYLERLLLLGQDSGAFRPGIYADDVYALIISLAFYRHLNNNLMLNLFDIDMHSPTNTEGMHRLIVDTVLAFLTSHIPASGQSSYLSNRAAFPGECNEESPDVTAVYGDSDSGSDLLPDYD